MLAVPPALLDLLKLTAGTTVGIAVDHGRLVINPNPKPSYVLDELLAQCDQSAEASPEDMQWLSAPPVGKELL